MKEVLSTAVELHKEVNRIKNPVIKPASQLVKPVEPFKPKCDANFKVIQLFSAINLSVYLIQLYLPYLQYDN